MRVLCHCAEPQAVGMIRIKVHPNLSLIQMSQIYVIILHRQLEPAVRSQSHY